MVRITSTSTGTFTVYSDSGCTSTVTNGDFTFATNESSKTFYIKDTKKSSPTWTLSATRQSGDSLTTGTQTYTVNAGSQTRLVITLPSQTFTDGSGNSGSVDVQTAGSSFTITKISATDDNFNVVTSYSGTKTLSFSGPNNAPDTTAPSYTTSVSFTSGQSTTTLMTTLYKAETTTITVTDSGSYGYASSSLTVNAGATSTDAADSTVDGPTTGYVNEDQTITVTLKDAYQNPTASVSGGNIDFTGTTAAYTVSTGPSDTDASGISTSSLNWTTTGAKTVTVAVTDVGTLSDTHSITIGSRAGQMTLQGGFTIRGGAKLGQ